MRRALIEGYSYCPYCGGGLNPPWACCGSTVASYYPRLRQARAEGWINRTVFCFGWMLAKSQWNPGGWTHESLRAEATKLKHSFPELGGIAFYGHVPGNASKGASRESRQEDTATIELIRYASALALELYPSPARSKTDDGSLPPHLDGIFAPSCAARCGSERNGSASERQSRRLAGAGGARAC